jgi:superoxide dismutase, Fe-Mn family
MRYQLAPLYCRPWTLNGISPRLIESHYENNYGAALSRLNTISEEIEQLDRDKTADQALARLKRDEIAALNSTILHELYFASLGGDGRVVPDAMASAIAKDFGSVDRWRQEFISIANGLAGGSGWVLLTYVPRDGRLINQIASEHNQSVAGGVPILALDMYEHAYHLEFGANAGAYAQLSCATSIGLRSPCDMRMRSRSRHHVHSNRSSLLTSLRFLSRKSVRC